MPSQLAIGDIKVALNERRFPAITTWFGEFIFATEQT